MHPLGIRKIIAANVRAELARRGKTPADLVEVLSISRQTAYRRARGERDFTAGDLATLASWLDMPVAELLPAPALVAA